MKIGVIIVAWNSGSELNDCIAALIRSKKSNDRVMGEISIVIVDNGSTDGSVEQLCARYSSDIILISLPQNEGFAHACNVGANSNLWDYIYFLNPDTEFSWQSIFLLCGELEKSERQHVGIAGPQLKDSRGEISRSCSRYPSLRSIIAGFIKVPFIFGSPTAMLEWDHRETRIVDQVIGAAFMIRGRLFRQLEGFDERFFVYYEEVDLCLRAYQAGYTCLYLSEIQGMHSGGGSSNQIRIKRLFYVWRSRLLYGAKHFSLAANLGLYGFNLFVEPLVRLLRSLALGHRTEIKDLIFVWWKIFVWLMKSRNGKILSENRSRLK